MQRDASAGRAGLHRLDGLTLACAVDLARPRITLHNVGGVLPGEGELSEECVVIAAHYDHLGLGGPGSRDPGQRRVHPGADDNASGTVGVLELAASLSREARRLRGLPRRSVVFLAFSGEERGLLGSNYFVRHMPEAGLEFPRITAMLNMDMIGRMRGNKLIVMGVGTGKQWPQRLERAASGLGLEIKPSESGLGPSDHTSFYLRDVPVLHFFTGTHADYHQPTDTADKINADGALKTLRLIESLTTGLWGTPERIAFQKTKDAHGGGRMTGGVYLGLVPDYTTAEGDRGCGLDGVSPGSPAEKAGLKGGDFIVRWDDMPVRNIHDLMRGLNAGKAGQTVRLLVRRGADTLELRATLGAR
jgi:hypothetical protein